MKENEKILNKGEEFKKEIKSILEPYVASCKEYSITIHPTFMRDTNDIKVTIGVWEYNNHSNVDVIFKQYNPHWNDFVSQFHKEEIVIEVLYQKEFILQEVEKIRQQEETLQKEKAKLLATIFE